MMIYYLLKMGVQVSGLFQMFYLVEIILALQRIILFHQLLFKRNRSLLEERDHNEVNIERCVAISSGAIGNQEQHNDHIQQLIQAPQSLLNFKRYYSYKKTSRMSKWILATKEELLNQITGMPYLLKSYLLLSQRS